MADIQTLLEQIDHLPPEDFERLYRHVQQRRWSMTSWGVVPPKNLHQIREVLRPVQEDADLIREEEINAVIDEAIAEVRRERKAKSSD